VDDHWRGQSAIWFQLATVRVIVLRSRIARASAWAAVFIFDFSAFAPAEDITIELAGRARTQSCLVEDSVLTLFR